MEEGTQDKFRQAEFWDRVAGQRVYAAFDEEEYKNIIFKTLGEDLTGKSIVDVGSASGVSAALMAARGASVLGIDISPELVNQANELWAKYSDRIAFRVGDAENLDIENSSFDACFFGGVLHHFPERDRLYEETLRVLKPGGVFIAIEPNRRDFLELIEWAVADLRGKLAPQEFPIDPIEMRGEMREAGFSSVKFWTTRADIPVLNQIPLFKLAFSRHRGFWFKRPMLRILNAFRAPESRGTFFVIVGQKPDA